MAKSSSPIRLDQALMSQAKVAAGLHKRSQAEQIEYWATIGRSMSSLIDPDVLIRIKSGVTKIRLENTEVESIDVEDVFNSLDIQRDSGSLSEHITSSKVAYRASEIKAGFLEQIDAKGNIAFGHFENGQFIET